MKGVWGAANIRQRPSAYVGMDSFCWAKENGGIRITIQAPVTAMLKLTCPLKYLAPDSCEFISQQ